MADIKYVKGYAFKNQWLNFSLYFTNFLYKTKNNPNNNKVCEWITLKDRLKDNVNSIGGKEINNKFLVNGDVTNTDFIEINKNDFIDFFRINDLGFQKNIKDLDGNYKRNDNSVNYADNLTNQERETWDVNSEKNNNDILYFMKGTNVNDIIEYVVNSKIV